MEELNIVKRRSRILPVLLTLFVVAILLLAGMWMFGMLPGIEAPTFGAIQLLEPAAMVSGRYA